ncbi:hypothetical protein BDSB_26355 [Burkholderia dolosa PC543]|nr:hypothetical protein BDSB_26355 [Burkholderia dolosa PC543]
MRASRPATAAHRVDVRAARDEPVLASDEVQAKASSGRRYARTLTPP